MTKWQKFVWMLVGMAMGFLIMTLLNPLQAPLAMYVSINLILQLISVLIIASGLNLTRKEI